MNQEQDSGTVLILLNPGDKLCLAALCSYCQVCVLCGHIPVARERSPMKDPLVWPDLRGISLSLSLSLSLCVSLSLYLLTAGRKDVPLL